jgi:outer membrane protein assembly factor BamB
VNKRAVFLVFAIILSIQPVMQAKDWPQWRGPFLNGSTDEKNLPDTWSNTENVKWVCPLPGPGAATPVICNGKIFLTSTNNQSKDLLAICIDEKNGNELWRKKLGTARENWPQNNMASPSAVTDGTHVYFLFGSGDLAGLDCDGNILWQRNIEQEYGNLSHMFGYSSSPYLYKDRLFVLVLRRHTPYRPPDSDKPLNSFLLALDKITGEKLWLHQRDTDAQDESLETYSTPIPHEVNGHTEIIVFGSDHLTGHDLETGQELWRYGYSTDKKRIDWRTIPTPVVAQGLIFATRPKHNGLFALKTGGSGTLTDEAVVWQFEKYTPDCTTPLVYDGLLYVLDGIKAGKTLTCFDPAIGTQKWQGRLEAKQPYRASLTAADGKLYCIDEGGQAVVIASGPAEFKVISRIEMGEGPIQASIAIANKCLFIRTAQNLYCIGK